MRRMGPTIVMYSECIGEYLNTRFNQTSLPHIDTDQRKRREETEESSKNRAKDPSHIYRME